MAHGASLAHARAAPPETIRRFSRREPTTRTSADRSDAARKSAPRPHFSWNPPLRFPEGGRGRALFFQRDSATTRASRCRAPRGEDPAFRRVPAPPRTGHEHGARGRRRRRRALAAERRDGARHVLVRTQQRVGDEARPGERVVFLSAFLSVPNTPRRAPRANDPARRERRRWRGRWSAVTSATSSARARRRPRRRRARRVQDAAC